MKKKREGIDQDEKENATMMKMATKEKEERQKGNSVNHRNSKQNECGN